MTVRSEQRLYLNLTGADMFFRFKTLDLHVLLRRLTPPVLNHHLNKLKLHKRTFSLGYSCPTTAALSCFVYTASQKVLAFGKAQSDVFWSHTL